MTGENTAKSGASKRIWERSHSEELEWRGGQDWQSAEGTLPIKPILRTLLPTTPYPDRQHLQGSFCES
jgi:hypothetical protein